MELLCRRQRTTTGTAADSGGVAAMNLFRNSSARTRETAFWTFAASKMLRAQPDNGNPRVREMTAWGGE